MPARAAKCPGRQLWQSTPRAGPAHFGGPGTALSEPPVSAKSAMAQCLGRSTRLTARRPRFCRYGKPSPQGEDPPIPVHLGPRKVRYSAPMNGLSFSTCIFRRNALPALLDTRHNQRLDQTDAPITATKEIDILPANNFAPTPWSRFGVRY